MMILLWVLCPTVFSTLMDFWAVACSVNCFLLRSASMRVCVCACACGLVREIVVNRDESCDLYFFKCK